MRRVFLGATLLSLAAIAGCPTSITVCEDGADCNGTGGVAGAGGATVSSSSTASSSSTSSSSSSTSSSSSGVMPDGQNLALPCAGDADCGPGLACLFDSDDDPVIGGGPPNGYCSNACSSDGDCFGFGVCHFGSGPTGRCLLACDMGPPLKFVDDDLDPSKCHGRNDVRCMPIAGGVTACVPTCGMDEQCPAGRVCDPRSAVCVVSAHTGLPAGSACNPGADACAAQCVTFGGGVASCTSTCVLGATDPLASSPNCGGVSEGLCAFTPSGGGAGDFGFCAIACTQQSQCDNPAFWCFGVAKLTGSVVPNGYCIGATPCPNGSIDCKPQHVCTDSPFGPFCLDPMFP